MAEDPFAGQSVRDLLRARHGPGGLEDRYSGPIPRSVDDAWHRAWRLALARDRAVGPRSDAQR